MKYKNLVDAAINDVPSKNILDLIYQSHPNSTHHHKETSNMTAAEAARAAGLKNLSQVSDLSGTSLQTLDNWHKNKPKLFAVVLSGCLAITEQKPKGKVVFSAIVNKEK